MRGQTQSIGDAISIFLRETGLEQEVLETKVVRMWPEIMGPTIANLTRSVEVKDGMLYVRVNSAALKAQLFECRFDLVRKVNEAVGGKAIHDVRILG